MKAMAKSGKWRGTHPLYWSEDCLRWRYLWFTPEVHQTRTRRYYATHRNFRFLYCSPKSPCPLLPDLTLDLAVLSSSFLIQSASFLRPFTNVHNCEDGSQRDLSQARRCGRSGSMNFANLAWYDWRCHQSNNRATRFDRRDLF